MQKNAHRMEKNMGAPDIEVSSENERREYIKNTFKGGQLHRTKTLAQGDECCNFHVTRLKK